ncbi:MAG: tyrosine-type recombinase/integrase [Oscillospiraceae bacterium]|nr:tyrosine-type recombinase/integrase [Oscillospiraceae bacterium]
MELRSIFKPEMETYLALKKKTLTQESYGMYVYVLQNFDQYLLDHDSTSKIIDEKTVSGWIQQFYEFNSARTVSEKVSRLRKFLEYLRYSGFQVFIPNCPKYSDSYVPYIFSDNEIEKIFYAADKIKYAEKCPNSRCTRFKFPMLLRLLYGCGLRLGETLSIRMGDVSLDDGVLLLKNTKNKKQRIVPMSKNLNEMLRNYCTAMGLNGNPSVYLFPANKPDKHLSTQTADNIFRKILQTAGIYIKYEPYQRGQCLHCFRHLFAIKSFAQAEKSGRSVDDSIPFLSVYLGHYDMDGTQKYLKFNGDMFPEYTELFESYTAGVFSEALYDE